MFLQPRITRQVDEDEQRTAFQQDYQLAWEAAGKPSATVVEVLYTALLSKEELGDMRHHSLWVFFQSALEQNVALNWFGHYNPALLQRRQMLQEEQQRSMGSLGTIHEMIMQRLAEAQQLQSPEPNRKPSDDSGQDTPGIL